MDQNEIQAALNKANETVAQLRDDVSETNARADAIETQNVKLAEERDEYKAELGKLNDARLETKVQALVGVKFTAAEAEDQLALAKRDEELFDKLTEQRTPMTLLNKDPAKAGPDPTPKPAGAVGNGQGFANLVNAAHTG